MTDNTRFSSEQLFLLSDALNEGAYVCPPCQKKPHWGKITSFADLIENRQKQGRCIICGKAKKSEA